MDIGADESSIGAGHTHTIGGGSTLSRSSDIGRMKLGYRGDVENMKTLLDGLEKLGADVSNFLTVLGAENGDVLAWRGPALKGEGKKIGNDKCK